MIVRFVSTNARAGRLKELIGVDVRKLPPITRRSSGKLIEVVPPEFELKSEKCWTRLG